MNAIIYAAGRGSRLGASLADIPKILLSFLGRTLLDWHAERLAAAGIRRLFVVTGYESAKVEATLPGLQQKHGISIQAILNPQFTEGSVLSVYASSRELKAAGGEILLMDGDVLYPTEMLRRLIASDSPTALLIDRDYSTDDDDPVLVPVNDGRPFDFRKKWTGTAQFVGESVGFFKVAPPEVEVIIRETLKRTVGPARKDSYDEVIRALVMAGRFGYEDITGLPWTEIDFPSDIERANSHVLPEILELELRVASDQANIAKLPASTGRA